MDIEEHYGAKTSAQDERGPRNSETIDPREDPRSLSLDSQTVQRSRGNVEVRICRRENKEQDRCIDDVIQDSDSNKCGCCIAIMRSQKSAELESDQPTHRQQMARLQLLSSICWL